MKKIFAFAVITVLLLSIMSNGYCLNNVKWGRTDTYRQLKRQLPYDLYYLGHARGGVSTMVSGTDEVPLSYAVVKVNLYGLTKTMTIADGEPGQMITIIAAHAGAGSSATLTPSTSYGWSSILFDAAGEQVTLRYIDDDYGWIVENTIGATVTTVDEGE